MSPELDDYAQKKGIGYWNCKLSFYGATKANAANWAFAKEKFSEIPGVKFEDGESYKLPLTPEQQESSQAAIRDTESGTPDRRAVADESGAGQWSYVVFADHSADR